MDAGSGQESAILKRKPSSTKTGPGGKRRKTGTREMDEDRHACNNAPSTMSPAPRPQQLPPAGLHLHGWGPQALDSDLEGCTMLTHEGQTTGSWTAGEHIRRLPLEEPSRGDHRVLDSREADDEMPTVTNCSGMELEEDRQQYEECSPEVYPCDSSTDVREKYVKQLLSDFFGTWNCSPTCSNYAQAQSMYNLSNMDSDDDDWSEYSDSEAPSGIPEIDTEDDSSDIGVVSKERSRSCDLEQSTENSPTSIKVESIKSLASSLANLRLPADPLATPQWNESASSVSPLETSSLIQSVANFRKYSAPSCPRTIPLITPEREAWATNDASDTDNAVSRVAGNTHDDTPVFCCPECDTVKISMEFLGLDYYSDSAPSGAEFGWTPTDSSKTTPSGWSTPTMPSLSWRTPAVPSLDELPPSLRKRADGSKELPAELKLSELNKQAELYWRRNAEGAELKQGLCD